MCTTSYLSINLGVQSVFSNTLQKCRKPCCPMSPSHETLCFSRRAASLRLRMRSWRWTCFSALLVWFQQCNGVLLSHFSSFPSPCPAFGSAPPGAKIKTSILYPSWKLGWMRNHIWSTQFPGGIQCRSIYFRHGRQHLPHSSFQTERNKMRAYLG